MSKFHPDIYVHVYMLSAWCILPRCMKWHKDRLIINLIFIPFLIITLKPIVLVMQKNL